MSTVRVRAVVRNVVEKSDGSPQPFLGLEDIQSGTGRLLVDHMPHKRAEDSICHSPGDVLFSKLRPYLAKSYLPNSPGTGTSELLVMRPGYKVDSRFLFYVTLSTPWVEWSNATAYGTKMPRTSWDLVGAYGMWLPSLEAQRRIADFLDVETARIDRMIAATRAQHDLVRERESVAFTESVVRADGPRLETLAPGQHRDWPAMPLNRVLQQLTNGYVGPTRDLFVDEGVPYLQSLHIKHGKIDFFRRPYYVSPAWAAERPRIRLGFEDILIVQTGAIGEVGIVDESFVGASCHALLIARTDRSRLRPRFLWHALRSHWGRHALVREQTGALHPHLEAGNVRFMKFPIPSLRTQDRVVADAEAITRDVQTIQLALVRRLSLQAERRQALITAAVTGQFDVTTASGRNATEGVSA